MGPRIAGFLCGSVVSLSLVGAATWFDMLRRDDVIERQIRAVLDSTSTTTTVAPGAGDEAPVHDRFVPTAAGQRRGQSPTLPTSMAAWQPLVRLRNLDGVVDKLLAQENPKLRAS